MKIKEMENKSGITAKNIRFYEKEGLIKPQRGENGYREYTESHVTQLKQIKLLRRLGIPLQDIRLLQRGEITLERELEDYLDYLEKEMNKLAGIKEICRRLENEQADLDTVNPDYYLNAMEKMERKGMKFYDIIKDHYYRWKKEQSFRNPIIFEPDNPIITPKDFTNELFHFADKEKMDLVILQEGLEPIVRINGKRYLAMLEMPRIFPRCPRYLTYLLFALPIYGFMWVSMYPFEGE